MTSNKKVLLSLLLTATVAALPISAQDKDKDESVTTGGVKVGAQGGSGLDDSSKLQQYETIPEGVFLEEAWFQYSKKDFFMDFEGTKLGLDDQFAALTFGKKDGFDLKLSWDQNPNWQSNTAVTPYAETSPGTFVLPDITQRALQGIYAPWTGSAPANPTVPNFFALGAWVTESAPIDLRYLRRTGKADLNIKAGQYTDLKFHFQRELRDGNKNTTFYGGPSFEVATPIDYLTDEFRVEADFAKGRMFANASVWFSSFKNDVPYANIDNSQLADLKNPITGANVTNNATSFRLWLNPDNEAWSTDLTAGINFAKRHKLTGSLSMGTMSMETPLLPLSTNPYLTTSNAAFTIQPPYSDVTAEFDHFMGQVKFTGDPSTKFGYILSWRKFEMDDKTGDYSFYSTVRGDVGASYNAAGYHREHAGYSTENLRGEIHVTPGKGLRLGASYGQDKKTYDAREYADVTDDVLMLTGDYNYDWANLHVAWTTLDRKPGDVNTHAIQPTWQGATQTDITERNRHILSAIFTIIPNSKVAISLNGAKTTNEFAESITGLTDQTFDTYGFDVTFTPNDRTTFAAGYVRENYFFDMAAAYFPRGVTVPPNFNPLTDPNYWSNATEDVIDTFHVNLDAVLKPEKWNLNASFEYTKPESDSQYTFVPGGTGEANGVWPATPVTGFPVAGYPVPTSFTGFPLVSKTFYIAKVTLTYFIQKNLTASLMYWKQKYDNEDWQTQTEPYMGYTDPGANRWFFLGAQVPGYDADILRASLSYTF